MPTQFWQFQAIHLNYGVQINAEDAPRRCKFGVMSHKMRQTVLNGHNERRSLLAKGEVIIRKGHGKFPRAANMIELQYSCHLERIAVRGDLCNKIPPRTKFSYRGRNYAYITTPVMNFKPLKSPIDALLAAMREWWDTHLYGRIIQDVTPTWQDFKTLPFFMMAYARTPRVGCAVDLCRISKNLFATEKYYAVMCIYKRPHVRAGIPLYMMGQPCSKCPCGYTCNEKTKLCRRRR